MKQNQTKLKLPLEEEVLNTIPTRVRDCADQQPEERLEVLRQTKHLISTYAAAIRYAIDKVKADTGFAEAFGALLDEELDKSRVRSPGNGFDREAIDITQKFYRENAPQESQIHEL